MKIRTAGVVAVATVMVLNVQFSNLDKDSVISLSYLKNMAFAQGGENGGGGLDTSYKRDSNPCSITISGEMGYTGTIWGIKFTIPASGKVVISKSGQEIDCSSGGNSTCTPRDC